MYQSDPRSTAKVLLDIKNPLANCAEKKPSSKSCKSYSISTTSSEAFRNAGGIYKRTCCLATENVKSPKWPHHRYSYLSLYFSLSGPLWWEHQKSSAQRGSETDNDFILNSRKKSPEILNKDKQYAELEMRRKMCQGQISHIAGYRCIFLQYYFNQLCPMEKRRTMRGRNKISSWTITNSFFSTYIFFIYLWWQPPQKHCIGWRVCHPLLPRSVHGEDSVWAAWSTSTQARAPTSRQAAEANTLLL